MAESLWPWKAWLDVDMGLAINEVEREFFADYETGCGKLLVEN